MAKFAKRIILALFVLILAASLAVMCLTLEAQSVTGKKWTVVMTMKPPKENPLVPQPEIRFYIVVEGDGEGEAAINAHKHMSELLTTQAAERLQFLEAQQKK